MGIAEIRRNLAPAYKFFDKTLAWRCDQCAKMFFLNSIQEANSETIAPHILTQFRAHACVSRPAAAVCAGPPGNDDFDPKIIMMARDLLDTDRGNDRE